jgi:2',3'-cyclic-nucleotide 2'-phosphodiesterase (5'-nucleotidase family)
MARWASLIDKRRLEQPVVVLDTGDFYAPRKTEFQETKDRYFFRAMKLLRYDAVGIGECETRIGLDALTTAAKGYRIPVVSSNILDKSRRKPIAPTSLIRDVGSSRTLFGQTGGVRVGICSVALPGYIYGQGADGSTRYYVIEPKLATLEATMKLRAEGCDLIIVISHMNWDRSIELAKDVPGIDIVLNSHSSHPRTHEERVGSTFVIDSGPKETSFTEAAVTFAADSITVTAADSCVAAPNVPGDSRFLELEKRYSEEIKRLTVGARTTAAKGRR